MTGNSLKDMACNPVTPVTPTRAYVCEYGKGEEGSRRASAEGAREHAGDSMEVGGVRRCRGDSRAIFFPNSLILRSSAKSAPREVAL